MVLVAFLRQEARFRFRAVVFAPILARSDDEITACIDIQIGLVIIGTSLNLGRCNGCIVARTDIDARAAADRFMAC